MDFSTVDLALLSLTRRRPPLPDEVIDLSSRLSSLFLSASHDDDDDAEYVRGALRLVELGSTTPPDADAAAEDDDDDAGRGDGVVRWEPLAVGLRLIVDYLADRTEELRPPGGRGVYADGPRIPECSQNIVSQLRSCFS